jgi:hypothetical protein
MSYPIPPPTSHSDVTDPAQHQALPADQTGADAGGPLRRWLGALGAALERAEQRITENFKVPPHGG